MIDDFIERKWGRRAVEFMLPELEVILHETLGVIVYQEQVMQISATVAGYSLGDADLLRRAMGKKDPAEMAKQRDRFMSGAGRWKKKHPKDIAGKLFDLMEQFAGYGFNNRTRRPTRCWRITRRGSRRTIPSSSWRRS